MLEEEDHQTPMLSTEGIQIAKGEGVKTKKRVVPLIEAAPEDLPVNEEEDTMEWLSKWHRRKQQEKGQLQKDQELLTGDILNIQASIWSGSRDKGGKDQVGTIWNGICLDKRFARHR